jgi:hypothetical protein
MRRQRSPRRLAAGVAVGLLASVVAPAVGVIGLVVGATPAAARPQEPMVVKAGAPVSKTFSGIPGNYPGSAAAYWTPGGCLDPAFTWCDDVPLDIVRPDVDEATDWTVEVSVTWKPTDRNDNDVQSVQACDLDIWLFDDTQIEGRDSADPGYTQLDSSALDRQPEVVSTYAPELGRYNLVIVNFAGANLEYTVTTRLVIGHFDKPFEALAPTTADKSGGGDEGEAPPPADLSAESPDGGLLPSVAPDLEPSPLGEVAVLPDQDFGTFENASSFDDQLRAQGPQGRLPSIGLRPPADVPPAVLAFWFLLAPAALAAAAWVLIVRRRGRLAF